MLLVMDRHDQLLTHWRRIGAVGLRVVHVDSHCDMHGLLVDRQNQRAWANHHSLKVVTQGNFLTHAIAERRVQGVQWIHDVPGGRRDDTKTVRYTTDLSVRFLGTDLRSDASQHQLEFSEQLISAWPGIADGDFLDIDWDVFASHLFALDSIGTRVERFFAKSHGVPAGVAICYSPEYSHPSREAFTRFVERVSQRFGLVPQWLAAPGAEPSASRGFWRYAPASVRSMVGSAHRQVVRWLRHRGVF